MGVNEAVAWPVDVPEDDVRDEVFVVRDVDAGTVLVLLVWTGLLVLAGTEVEAVEDGGSVVWVVVDVWGGGVELEASPELVADEVELPPSRLASCTMVAARAASSSWTASTAFCSDGHTPCWNLSGKYLCRRSWRDSRDASRSMLMKAESSDS